ncbi:MAG TPA: SOS response-associated peptidase [Beijerinckia sp.]|jgi:putative SOS response-associated peptidase YedK|nr:SOS response-associated peptidase [Beijerinckia sp.]
MCGRFAVTLPPEAVRQFFRYIEQPNFPPRYNIAPTQPVPIVRGERDSSGQIIRHFALVRWGFLPSFVKDPKPFPLIFNARCESLLTKASFKNAMRRRRCLFIADAFYEWRREAKGKAGRPFLFRRRDRAPLGLGGLWETWIGPNGEEVDTGCIITTPANGATAAIHERLPAILEPERFDLWLEQDETKADEAFVLLRPPHNDVLEFFEIGAGVNKADNDGPEIQEPVEVKPLKKMPVQGRLF